MKQFRSVALTRYAAGSEGQQDALEADAELAMLAHQEASLRREHRVLDARLNALLHRSPADTLSPPPLRLVLPGEPLGVTISEAYSPEIAAADARVEAERSRVSATGRARLPLVKLGAAWDRFMSEPDWRGQVIAGVELPLWGGSGGPAKDEARAELARAEFERDARNDERGRAIEEATADYQESQHEIEVMELQLVPTSERALAAARAGFESGRANFLALILATRRRGEAKLELEAARVRAANGWAALRRATAADLTADAAGAPREEQGR
jgi:outer membrane protein TolC